MRRRVLAFGTALAVAAGGGSALTLEGQQLFRTPPPRVETLTTGQVHNAAIVLGRQCLGETADGTTVQTGSRENTLTTVRKFIGGITCTVVDQHGTLTSVTIQSPADSPSSPTSETTTETLYRENAAQIGTSDGATAWAFQIAASQPGEPAVTLEGYAATDGITQAWATSRGIGRISPSDVRDSELNIGGGNFGPNLAGAVLTQTVDYAGTALRVVTNQNEGRLPLSGVK